MPLQYDPTKDPYAFKTQGESLTEQEHKDSCDINIMMKKLHRGMEVQGASSPGIYGYDDMTMDGVRFRMEKARLENELSEISETQEFSEAELKYVPEKVKQKFKLRKKQEQKVQDKNDKLNDEKIKDKNAQVVVAEKNAEPKNEQTV